MPVPEAWAGRGVCVLVAATATTAPRRRGVAVPGVLEAVNDKGVHLRQDELPGGGRVRRRRMFYPWGAVLELRLAEDEWAAHDEERGHRAPEERTIRARLGAGLRRSLGI